MSLTAITGLAAEARIIRMPATATLVGAGQSDRLAGELEKAIANGARRLLSFGVAGGLAPHLQPGDIIIGRSLIDGARQTSCDAAWSAAMIASLARTPRATRTRRADAEAGTIAGPQIGMARTFVGLRAAKRPQPPSMTVSGLLGFARSDGLAVRAILADVAGVDAPVADPLDKAALHRATGAGAVDMESAVVARAAARHGLPFAILRVVADPAHRSLPSAALVALREDGGLNLAAVMAALARDVSQIAALARVARDARRAFASLYRARVLLGADFASLNLSEL